jgi:hypothetical protein
MNKILAIFIHNFQRFCVSELRHDFSTSKGFFPAWDVEWQLMCQTMMIVGLIP